jgi:methylmalonyl-CoA/ethylmalonyl-CoA epimerase
MTTQPLALSRIGQLALTVTDLDRAVTFYGDLLRLQHLFSFPGMAFFDCGGVRLMLTRPEGDNRVVSGGFTVYFHVEDIDAACATLRERGVRFEDDPHLIAKMPDHELWMAFFRDPDGHLLALMCERR